MLYLYILTSPIHRDSQCYVGITENPEYRFRQHLAGQGHDNRKVRWVKSLVGKGLQPIMNILCQVDEMDVDEAENDAIDMVRAIHGGGCLNGVRQSHYTKQVRHRQKSKPDIRLI